VGKHKFPFKNKLKLGERKRELSELEKVGARFVGYLVDKEEKAAKA
jgi:hypothetical protein